MRSLKVCSRPGCHELAPCPRHARPANAPWSRDRDRNAQRAFRQAILARDSYACTRCGSSDQLVAHHVRPGYDPDAGIALCARCHRAIDGHAR